MYQVKNIIIGMLILLTVIIFLRKGYETFISCEEEIEDMVENKNNVISQLNTDIVNLNSQIINKHEEITRLQNSLEVSNNRLDELKWNPIIDEETNDLLNHANETISDLLIKKKLDEQRINFCNRRNKLDNFQIDYSIRQKNIANLKDNIKELIDDSKDYSDQNGNIYLNHVQKMKSTSPSELIPSTF